MKKLLLFLKKVSTDKNDPVYWCKLYRDQGCSHVDGYLCDFPECSMNKEYILGLEA